MVFRYARDLIQCKALNWDVLGVLGPFLPESFPNETHFFKLRFTTCKPEQPLQSMELQ